MDPLNTITVLSHEFGTPDYVRGGGGNTSAKNAGILWVKPSGTTLAALTPEGFVALDRAKIDLLYDVATPADAKARETLVKDLMAAAVLNGSGRPSVEAPLHNALDAVYVVHTHPALVNGMTCAVNGEAFCRATFPESLWVEYIDPGYTLCMEVRRRIREYVMHHGCQPDVLFLRNHGVFIAGDTPGSIRNAYARVMHALATAYRDTGVPTTLTVSAPAAAEAVADTQRIRRLFGMDAAVVVSSGRFSFAEGPLTPDHLVYARAFPFTGALTRENADRYRAAHGAAPKVVVTSSGVHGIGTNAKNARLALEFAQDAALVRQLTGTFGGTAWISDAAREFIENWEVESYRHAVASS